MEARARTDVAIASARRVPAERLDRFVAEALIACGVPAGDAARIATAMIASDIAGADTHGIFRLPQYIGEFRAGRMNPAATVRVERRAGATALVDGGRGLGHLAMTLAVETAAAIAADMGVAWVGLRQSGHAGALGTYAEMLVERGFIGICTAVSGINQMAPSGGAEALLGSNPIAIGVPSGTSPPFILDIATSTASFGAVRSRALEGASLPEGWAIDRETGASLTDPKAIDRGLLLAFGGYKGLGLSQAIGLLAGLLNGADYGRAIPDFANDHGDAPDTGQFVVALKPDAFRPLADFLGDVDRHAEDFAQSKRLPGVEAIRQPGVERARRRAERLAHGIPLSPARLRQLSELATQLGIAPLA